jgi:hypothetical protein
MEMGRKARSSIGRSHTADQFYDGLMEIYAQAIELARG